MNSARNVIRTIDPVRVTVGDVDYAIYPFPAFKAANVTGDIMGLLLPMIGSLAPLLSKEGDVLDEDMEEAIPAVSAAFSSISGDKLEKLLKKLLIEHQNIATEIEDEEGKVSQVILTEEVINNYRLFAFNVQEMYLLAFQVLKVNYSGFFEKIGSRFGTQSVQKMTAMFQNMAT